VDTSAWLALGNPSDGRHVDAKRTLRELRDARLVTSDYVIDETITRWVTSGRAAAGLRFVRGLLDSPRTELVHVSPGIFHEALARIERYAEHRLSLTDCTNLVLIEQLGLDGLFAFDVGFGRAGAAVLPEA